MADLFANHVVSKFRSEGNPHQSVYFYNQSSHQRLRATSTIPIKGNTHRESSKVSPKRGLNGFPILSAFDAHEETAKAVTRMIRSIASSHIAAYGQFIIR